MVIYQNCLLHGVKDEVKLAKTLGTTEEKIKELLLKTLYSTRRFNTGKKIRLFEIPCGELKELQRKINRIFQQIELPEYLQSGRCGYDYVKNAKLHQHNKMALTLDIASFYPSVKAKNVETFFIRDLKMGKDAAEMLTKFVTYNGHLPTGAPTSQALAFLAHNKVFDEINKFTEAKGLKMTLYVDDITISGEKFNPPEIISFVAKILNKVGLRLNDNKIKLYDNYEKIVTGVYTSKYKKLSIKNALGAEIVKAVAGKDLKNLERKELQMILGKIAAAQRIQPDKFKKLKKQIIKIIKNKT